MNNYRVERVLSVTKDGENGCVVLALLQGMHGHVEEPSERGEMEILIEDLDDLRFYLIKGKKREKVRIDKPDRFTYVIKGWLKKMEATADIPPGSPAAA